MRALIVYCHPREDSFTAAVRNTVTARLAAAGAEFRLLDLYARGFDPVMDAAEHGAYLDAPANRAPVAADVEALLWADTLIFIYPTWWYGLPAMLKGWLDRVLLPDVAFLMPGPGQQGIRPGLTRITRLGVFTTCGASRWLTWFIGAPGKRTLMRGVALICAPHPRRTFAAHYLMDASTAASRARHLARVGRKMDRLIAARPGARPRRDAPPAPETP
ncbi:NAD(P)H dehydrogenase [Defluviimonas sp. 20V17]|uniref:NAD(P)H dehydrogenase (Quinone) n=1 Tax=Allgaiera indica TaxID=765699 RepID=A0AAN4ZZW8_9RHOB|nr:NAD(P)H-dependent oxidoreductase [Allgaiera indica]KDB02039.1 NAD(P)H dehydrogenase [Defluviimonas sp. 20V17]GHE03076.1 NAD(P)H dehydrogenase (quinone) [Allgaiera indica]SDX11859.1 Putative NADPH-quinone reductase (modulator of drug activity B) [Allgaiera indica]